jgi:hypothetical protein
MNGMIGVPGNEYKNLDMSMSAFDQAGSFNDKEFSDIRKQFQQKLRNTSILKIRKSIEDNIISIYKFDISVIKQKLTDLTKTLEEKIFKLCVFKVDDLYQKKVQYVLFNIKFLGNKEFKEFCDLMFVKQSLNAGKLVTTHPQFKDWANEI